MEELVGQLEAAFQFVLQLGVLQQDSGRRQLKHGSEWRTQRTHADRSRRTGGSQHHAYHVSTPPREDDDGSDAIVAENNTSFSVKFSARVFINVK